MLSRRLFSSSIPCSAVRALSTTSSCRRTPSLADIEPNGAPAFDARQKEFRDRVKEAQKAKEKQDSQSVTASSLASAGRAAGSGGGSPTAPDASNAGPPSSASSSSPLSYSPAQQVGNGQALGSLSTHTPGSAREATQAQESSKRQGALSSLIYGTHEGQQMDREIEKSFSQVLARGKYMHSIVFHTVKPDKVDEYVDLVGAWYPKVAKTEDHHVNLVGSWRTEVGDCDTFGEDSDSLTYRSYLCWRPTDRSCSIFDK